MQTGRAEAVKHRQDRLGIGGERSIRQSTQVRVPVTTDAEVALVRTADVPDL